MRSLAHIFKENEYPERLFQPFWDWFVKEEKRFYDIIDQGLQTESGFFEIMDIALGEICDGIFILTGKADDDTAELIFTADGNPLYIPLVEILVLYAPTLPNWTFTASKPAFEQDDMSIQIGDIVLSIENVSFYPTLDEAYPDTIALNITHPDFRMENMEECITGVFIFLENYLGELKFLETIDNVQVVDMKSVTETLIPISKLKDYIRWRVLEFTEKNQSATYTNYEDNYALLEAITENGNDAIAIVNADLLHWEGKAAYPWIGIFTIKYDGSENSGMPNERDNKLMDNIEDELLEIMDQGAENVFVGRQTVEGNRMFFIVLKDYKVAALIFNYCINKFQDSFDLEAEIYKDKYWRTLEQFMH